ncbi:DUF1127 domain-containing protein [Algihabitans albus]|uniref:DUF1127 domain-containing protein n=1 Tax=Algihabitans albus TaxID=2164067 RepID=UPI0013C2B5A0|nr:DUF1127 domain-containing protein [Algihabitans albus]
MARLTDRELTAVLKAKTFGTPLATQMIVAEAKRLQAEAVHDGFRKLFQMLKLPALFRIVQRETICRRTRTALAQLDDATLRDIGLHRGEIADQARRCANTQVPAR